VRAVESAYQLLASASQEQLRARAEFARALSGRTFEPWQMFAEGRFALRVMPRDDNVSERIEGDRATVTVQDQGARADVPLIREDGHWRLVLEIPEHGRP